MSKNILPDYKATGDDRIHNLNKLRIIIDATIRKRIDYLIGGNKKLDKTIKRTKSNLQYI